MYQKIIQSIQSKTFAPVYYLHGEESWFIDQIVAALDADSVVLNASERAFNRTVCYGPESAAKQIIQECRSFPVMAQYRMVIVKEAQRLNKTETEKLVSYLEQPIPSTILILIFKGKNSGFSRSAEKKLHKSVVHFHAKKLYERDVQKWIGERIQAEGFSFEAGIPAVLTTNLGIEIGLIQNELEKMFIYLKANQQSELKQAFVYETINVDKAFNVFELVNALSKKDRYKAHMIIDRLSQNTKIHPPIRIINGLFRFFHHVALVHRYKLRDTNSIKNQLGINYYQALDCANASQRYNLAQTYRNIGFIQELDLSLKGMRPTHMDERHLLKTLVMKLLG